MVCSWYFCANKFHTHTHEPVRAMRIITRVLACMGKFRPLDYLTSTDDSFVWWIRVRIDQNKTKQNKIKTTTEYLNNLRITVFIYCIFTTMIHIFIETTSRSRKIAIWIFIEQRYAVELSELVSVGMNCWMTGNMCMICVFDCLHTNWLNIVCVPSLTQATGW